MPPMLQSLHYKAQQNNLMAAASSDEDFTFPATTASPPRFLESPPLWLPEKSTLKEVEDEKLGWFQEFEKGGDFREDHHEEEKMDVLWENLNDESAKNSTKVAEMNNCEVSSPSRGVQISCAQSLKLSRANGHMFSGKKPIIFMFINVVKKVLLMQSSHHRIKKQAW